MAQLVGALCHRPKGCMFDSQSGHMPGVVGSSPVGAHMRRQLINVSVSPSSFLSESSENMFSGGD